MHTIEPGTEGAASFRSQLWIAIVGIDRRVQQRAASRHQSSAAVPKITHNLFKAVNGIWDLFCAFEAHIHRDFPSVVEGVSRKLLLAPKMPVDSALFQPGRSHEVGKRSAVISFLIEDWGSLADDFLPSLLAFAHALLL